MLQAPTFMHSGHGLQGPAWQSTDCKPLFTMFGTSHVQAWKIHTTDNIISVHCQPGGPSPASNTVAAAEFITLSVCRKTFLSDGEPLIPLIQF